MNKIAVLLSLSLISSVAQAETDWDAHFKAVARGDFNDSYRTDLYGYDKGKYSECVLNNSANARAPAVMESIKEACRIQATPAKCRDLSVEGMTNKRSAQQLCYDACLKSNCAY